MKWKIAFVLLLTLGLLIVVLWDVPFADAVNAVRQANPLYIGFMFIGYVFSHLLRSFRLWILLDQKTRYLRVLSINTIGFLAINVMPLRLGEMVRPYLFMEREGISMGEGLAAIFLERLLDMLMLLVMLLGLGYFVTLPDQGLRIKDIDVVAVGQSATLFIVTAGVIGILGLIFMGERWFVWLERIRVFALPVRLGRKFREGLLILVSKPIRATGLLVLSMIVWLLTILSVMMALMAFQDLPHTFGSAWTTWTVTLAGMVAVPTPGFLGIYELSCSAALSLLGVGETLSKTFAVCLHVGQLVFISVLGFFFMLQEGLSLKSLSVTPDTMKNRDPK